MIPLVYAAPGIYLSPTRPILFFDIPTLRGPRRTSARAVGREAIAAMRAYPDMDRFTLVARLGGIPNKPQL